MSDKMLKVENVSKQYRLGAIGGATLKEELQSLGARIRGKENPNLKIGQTSYTKNETFWALKDVSFEVSKGEAVGIIGRNGAGKSTILKLISRITAPTKGNIYLNGRITSMLEVGTGFHPELTGRENVYLNGAILGMTKREIDSKFDEIVEFSEISKFIDTPVKRYSSGMYVKLAFSVAAHLNSDIMIMDEVLAVGDVDFQKKCLGRMSEASVHENRTVLYVSHNISTVRSLCTKCLVLDHGKVSYLGDVETGISMYLGLLNEESKNEFDLSKKPRRIDTAMTSGVRMQHAALIGRDKNIYKTGEAVELKIFITSESNREAVHVGITNMYVDGTRIGGTTSNLFDLKKGENEILISIPTDAIPDGVYSFEFTLNQKDKNDMNVRLDSAKQAIPFSIVNDGISFTKNWDHNTFGHAAYAQATVKTM